MIEPRKYIPDHPNTSNSQCRYILDERLLILGRSLDGRSSLLLLVTTTGSKEDTTEEGAENAHGKLDTRSKTKR